MRVGGLLRLASEIPRVQDVVGDEANLLRRAPPRLAPLQCTPPFLRAETSVQRVSLPRVVTCGIRRVCQLIVTTVGLRCVAAGAHFPQAQLGFHAGRHYLYSWGGSSTVRRCTADVLSAGLLATYALVVCLAFHTLPRCRPDWYC